LGIYLYRLLYRKPDRLLFLKLGIYWYRLLYRKPDRLLFLELGIYWYRLLYRKPDRLLFLELGYTGIYYYTESLIVHTQLSRFFVVAVKSC
jgi:hypothetical protein